MCVCVHAGAQLDILAPGQNVVVEFAWWRVGVEFLAVKLAETRYISYFCILGRSLNLPGYPCPSNTPALHPGRTLALCPMLPGIGSSPPCECDQDKQVEVGSTD